MGGGEATSSLMGLMGPRYSVFNPDIPGPSKNRCFCLWFLCVKKSLQEAPPTREGLGFLGVFEVPHEMKKNTTE